MVGKKLKAQSNTISTVLLAAVTITAVGVVLNVSDDVITETEDYATIDTAVEFMNIIDEDVREVSSEGIGSTRVQNIPMDDGTFRHSEDEDIFWWEIETEAEPVSPQTQSQEGEAILANNAGVTVSEEEVAGQDCFRMENDRMSICIWAEEREQPGQDLGNDELILDYQVEGQSREDDFDFDLWVNEDEDTSEAETWAQAETGAMLPRGTVEVYKQRPDTSYVIQFVLYSGADFVSVTVDDI